MLRSVSHVNPRADSPHVPVLHREVVSWLDLEPAIAAIIGLVVLGQALGTLEIAAMGCVVVASAAAARAAAA